MISVRPAAVSDPSAARESAHRPSVIPLSANSTNGSGLVNSSAVSLSLTLKKVKGTFLLTLVCLYIVLSQVSPLRSKYTAGLCLLFYKPGLIQAARLFSVSFVHHRHLRSAWIWCFPNRASSTWFSSYPQNDDPVLICWAEE